MGLQNLITNPTKVIALYSFINHDGTVIQKDSIGTITERVDYGYHQNYAIEFISEGYKVMYYTHSKSDRIRIIED